MPSWTQILLPLGSLVLGILLQHFLSGRRTESEKQSENKYEIYSEYLRSVGARDKESLVIAKTKLMVVGSNQVCARVAEFERKGPNLNNPVAMDLFCEIVLEMRKEASPRDKPIQKSDLMVVLFSKDWEKLL